MTAGEFEDAVTELAARSGLSDGQVARVMHTLWAAYEETAMESEPD